MILWLHGGVHLMGSALTHRAMLARLGALTGCRACLPEFRLAPEHPYPAGLEDALAVWDGLVAAGHAPGSILLGGDSSGGGLMLALLARLLARGQRPAAALAFSPWTDLTGSGASLVENAGADPMLPVSRYAEACGYYLAGTDPADPGASPLYARFPGCPPVWLHVSQTEILRDDTLRMARASAGRGRRGRAGPVARPAACAGDVPGLDPRGRRGAARRGRLHPETASRSPASRKLTASATCRRATAALPSRSAMVRATRITR